MTVIFIIFFTFTGFVFSQNAWINEFHYDNVGSDVGEFIEVVIENANSYSLNNFTITLYDGSTGTSYDSQTIDNFIEGVTVNNFTLFYWEPAAIQQSVPEGFSLDYNGNLIQLLSYEGYFTATDGPANGHGSLNIGVFETSTTASGESLQLSGNTSYQIGYSTFDWNNPLPQTKGMPNSNQILFELSAWVDEFHYNNNGTDVGEFIEILIKNPNNFNLEDFAFSLYDGFSGDPYAELTLDEFTKGVEYQNGLTVYYYEFPTNGIQNGQADGFSLNYIGNILQFSSYEGILTANTGPAAGLTSVDIGVSESINTLIGSSLTYSGNIIRVYFPSYPFEVTENSTMGTVSGWTPFPDGLNIQLKVYLEGPYFAGSGEMLTNLNNSIPLLSPYSEDLRRLESIPTNIVDWILVELRSTLNSSAITSHSALLHRDGRIVADDGMASTIRLLADPGNYYIVIKHRNHLPIISPNAVLLTKD